MNRTGWRAGPIRPESAVLPTRRDPARLGAITFAVRWPRTHRLLTGEFKLSRQQAWDVARTAHRHAGLLKRRLRLRLRLTAAATLVSPAIIVFGVVPLTDAFIDATLARSDIDHLLPWLVGISSGLAALVLTGWGLYERFGMDALIERAIRDCWRDRVCLWCSHDMDEAVPAGDRWAVCPECGMRSPIAVRTP